jgi:hypothetical protein
LDNQTLNTSWHSYPSIYALGHRFIKDLFLDDVLIEEKIDGSQFSMGRFGGELKVRSKGAVINADYPEKMFSEAVEVAKSLDLRDGWTYRAEYLKKPKHNTLAYDRIPEKYLILFDINSAEETYLTYNEKKVEAKRVGLEVVPILFFGKVEEPSVLLSLLETPSILGGQKIEGMVIKNYSRFGIDKKVLMGKYVSEAFKEVHSKEWKKSNLSNGNIIQKIVMSYKTAARWQKAVQHLKEAGLLEGSPRDIGNLIKEVQLDVAKECEDEIKEMLYKHAKQHILRGISAGLPEWYKEQLMKEQFK